jgi:hypothetical protein
MRNIEKYIEDHAAEDVRVILKADLMGDMRWYVRLEDEMNHTLCDRNGHHFMVAWNDNLESALVELDELAAIQSGSIAATLKKQWRK